MVLGMWLFGFRFLFFWGVIGVHTGGLMSRFELNLLSRFDDFAFFALT
jgi:hypothetical protein